ncbi:MULTISPECIES: universal stress protein [Amycolatopsis]|uniref:Universal stress protein n=1 Tax=Amycolatopsis dendrobii TaxID=2760662 RepID=A0A7W3W616_9PSEU|nr:MULTISPECIES: universal stress protein [Amycolatopsis]MBB1159488.1 universal stress protein [Amycolatopsis dendrobii]UKD57427.1 universal stress protein [Amycolatopsis sp. FU40]
MSGPEESVVLAGIDGSASARNAAVWAAEEADRRSAVLRLVQAYLIPSPGITGPFVAGVRSGFQGQAEEWLDEAEAAVRERWPAARIERVVAEGNPVAVLLGESRGAELAVLGSRGLGGFTGLLVGSTAVALAAHAPCPVVVVRGRMPDDVPPATGPVVVGLDGAADSDEALEFACAAAAARKTSLTVVRTWNELSPDGTLRSMEIVPDEVAAGERCRIEGQLALWREKYPELRIDVEIVRGRPVRTLLEYGESARLVVVGSRGRGGFAGMLLGSTSQALLAHSTCPVAVVRPRSQP